MKQFAVITPTVGRPSLLDAIRSVSCQICDSFVHIVVGDGPRPYSLHKMCEDHNVLHFDLPQKMGDYGSHCRNAALDLIEKNNLAEYIVYLDDDNVFFPSGLQNFSDAIKANNSPPILYQCFLLRSKVKGYWAELPLTRAFFDENINLHYNAPFSKDWREVNIEGWEIPSRGPWDGHCGCFKTEVVSGLRWIAEFDSDYVYASEAKKRTGQEFVKVEGILGVHF